MGSFSQKPKGGGLFILVPLGPKKDPFVWEILRGSGRKKKRKSRLFSFLKRKPKSLRFGGKIPLKISFPLLFFAKKRRGNEIFKGILPPNLRDFGFLFKKEKSRLFLFFFRPEPLSISQTKGSFLGPKGTRMKRPPPLGFCEKEPKKGGLNPF